MHIIDDKDFKRMLFHVHSPEGRPAGAFFEPEEAAMFVVCLGDGACIADPDGTILWSEGSEAHSAGDSYDGCAESMLLRLPPKWKKPGLAKTTTSRFTVTSERGGGSLIGYVTCSYTDLVKAFGEPNGEGDGGTSWELKDTVTGDTFELYDYKETNLYDDHDAPSVVEFRKRASYDWHIGGVKGRFDFKAFAAFISKPVREGW